MPETRYRSEVSFTMLMLPPRSELSTACAQEIRRSVSGCRVVVATDADEAASAIGDADAAFGTLSPDLLASARRLRWLQAPAAAPPVGYFFPELLAHPVIVTNLRGVYSDHVATHALAFMLSFARGFDRYQRQQAARAWRPDRSRFAYLPESTVLIIGAGAVGAELARLLVPFGSHVVGVDALHKDPPLGVAELHPPGHLDRLLVAADFVVLTIPHTPQTEGLMDLRRFRLMKPSAFLINVGRGPTVKLDDLAVAVAAGDIGGAGLDVFEHEPLPPAHPLWTLDGVLITPHVAVAGPHLIERRVAVVVENARRFAAGQDLQYMVDKANWY
jgi:phosphoglycerate dehydrogenase-like enzyme